MRRFFIPPEQLDGPRPFISGSDARHLRVVLRLQPGDVIAVLDGRGNECQARIVSMDHEKVYVDLQSAVSRETDSPVELTLAQGYLKDKKMDALVRPLTELGVTRWIPFMAARSVPVPDQKRLAARRQRWQKITLEALKQCGRRRPMAIDPVMSFQQALEAARPCDVKLVFWEKTAESRDRISIQTVKPASLFVLIGPEGGFDAHEVDRARQEGFLTAGMGPRILRAETAALCAAVVSQFVFGDMGYNFLDNPGAV
jgi:16S rRNA (uracil1498-N3)-methyltransferase